MRVEYRGEVWQMGMRVAMSEGKDKKRVHADTVHYAIQYAQDGPVDIRFKEKINGRWKLQGKLKCP